MSTRQVPLFTGGDAAGAVRVWRSGEALIATVIVKATFALAHERPAQIAAPEPVIAEDRTFGNHPMRSVERAAETAPHLARCDVLLTGHAHAPGGRPSASARLAVFKDRTALVDRTIHVFGDRKSGGAPQPFEKMPLVYERAFGGAGVDANPVGTNAPNLVDPKDAQRPAAFGPISRFWPARKRRIASLPTSALGEGIWSLPEAFSWEYFQAAPPEQQAPFLGGDEWIVLDGVHPQLPRLQTRLPGVSAAARLVGRSGDTPVALRADMLILDADKGTCAVVWRGRAPVVGGEQALSSMAVAAGVELPGKPIRWENLLASARSAAVSPPPELDATIGAPPPPAAKAEVGESTMGMSDAQQAAQSLRAVAPFQVATTAPPSSKSLAATPWGGPLAPAPASPVGESTLALPGPPRAPPATPSFASATPPPAAPATPPVVAPAPLTTAPVPATAPVATAPVAAPAPVTTAPFVATAPVATPPVVTPPVAAPKKPLTHEERLRAAGMPAEDVARLLAALEPPPPPPEDDV